MAPGLPRLAIGHSAGKRAGFPLVRLKAHDSRLVALVFAVVALLVLTSAACIPFMSSNRPAPQIDITRSEATVRFPFSVTFRITGTSDVSVSSISLEFSTPRARYGDYARRIRVLGSPGSEFDANWTWEPAGNPNLPPGAEVRYRWVLETRDGPHQTDDQSVTFDDPRFEWQEKTGDGVRLLTYTADEEFADQMVADAEQALARISDEMKLQPTGTVSLYVYEGQEALRGALPFSPIWIGGVAFAEFDTILMSIPTGSSAWARSVISHELSHQVTYQLTFNPSFGSQIPPWLNEGLAVVSEPDPDPHRAKLLADAVQQDKIPTLRSLAAAFPDVPHLAGVDYAASESAVRFIIARYGPEKLRDLLAAFQTGMTTTDALQATYGFTQDEVEDQWRESLGLAAHNRPVVATPTPQPTLSPTILEPARPPRREPEDILEIPAVRIGLTVFAAIAGFIVVTFAVSSITRRD